MEIEKAKLEKEKLEQEKQEKARLEKERLAKEVEEKAKLEKERLEKERVEKEKLEKERLAKEAEEKGRLEKERLEKERLAKETEEKTRLEKERQDRNIADGQEKTRLERELLARENEEKTRVSNENQSKKIVEKAEQNRISNVEERGKFNKGEENFINKYYNGAWKFSPDDRNNSLLKYNQSIGGGAALITLGSTTFLAGLISMVVMFNYYEVIIEDEWDYGIMYSVTKNVYPAYNAAPVIGGILMPLGGLLCIFSAIPFWFSHMVATIYKKETGGKLAFFERVNFNIGFVMDSNKSNEMRNKFNLSMSISL